jgi:hypothetical protein
MEKNEKMENKIVQTYAEDVAKVIENDTGGLIKKIIHGEEEHEAEKKNLSPESKKNKFFMFISILLLFLALATLSFFLFRKNINTIEVEKQFVPIIFNDQSTYLEVFALTKDEIAQTVLNEINTTKVKSGGVEGIYLTENKRVVGLRRFISLIKGNFVPGDNTLFINDNFLMGVVNSKVDTARAGGEGFFILLKVRSTADIFDALHAWEGKMFSDLRGFFGVDISPETKYLFTKDFEDGIVENKNARLLYDKDGLPAQTGKLVVMYIFADDNSVIITNTPNAAHEIMLRLAGSQKKQ